MLDEVFFENVRELMRSRNLSKDQIDAHLSMVILTCMEVGIVAKKGDDLYVTELVNDDDVWDVVWDKVEKDTLAMGRSAA